MPTGTGVTFGHRGTVAAYDDLQVPTLGRPWAERLAAVRDSWRGLTVLDLATGTGIVAQVLAPHVGPEGRIIGADASEDMLVLARRRCAGLEAAVTFVRSAAHPLDLPDDSVDVVVCQQGFQFFPDRAAAAAGVFRVLRPGGAAVVTTWRSLAECEFFRCVRDALADIGEPGLAARMHVPFDGLPADELRGHFARAGFADVEVVRRQLLYTFPGGMAQAVATARSTVAGPELAGMSGKRQTAFAAAVEGRLRSVTCDGSSMGLTVTNLLTARKTR